MTTVTPLELPRPTSVREDWIELSDGCRLFSRTVLPADAEADPVPAVLEYLPYRLSDGSAWNDAAHHPYFAGHGYAGVRVDIRGTGNSDGILIDEYLPREQEDACEVIAWLARQPWCTGAVGMFGKSWGGFNGLQVAARRPPALRAVVSAYSTDDRYADDVHYMGGCVLAHEALSWASYMLGLNALPPDPAIVGERWRTIWLERLERTPYFLEAWLAHQRRDDFWRQGSICEDFGALDAAILMVGGWADGYTNAVGRTIAGLSAAGVPCRGLIGPWSHGWPEAADPGPRIGFLQECLRWWDHWLKGEDNGAMDQPLLRAWMQEHVQPAPHHRMRPGRWVAEQRWPSPRIEPLTLFAHSDGGLREGSGPAAQALHVASVLSGRDCGAWCPYGNIADLATDQRAEDGLALTFETDALSERIELLGVPRVDLDLAVDQPLALVAVRLCDVAPDGSSLLVARGLLNLTHRDGHAEPRRMEPGAATVVSLPLDLSGHAFAPGHRLRLAVTAGYWPYAWPSPVGVELRLVLGAHTCIELPVRPSAPLDDALEPFEDPERTPPPAGHLHHAPWRSQAHDVGAGRVELEVGATERTHLDASGLEFGETVSRRYTIHEGDPLSARIEHGGEHFMRRGDWRIRVRTGTSMSATADSFLLTKEIDAYEGDTRIWSTRGSVTIPRDLV